MNFITKFSILMNKIVCTDGQTENLSILQDFVPYRSRCPATAQLQPKNYIKWGKGTADHMMPLGAWFLLFLFFFLFLFVFLLLLLLLPIFLLVLQLLWWGSCPKGANELWYHRLIFSQLCYFWVLVKECLELTTWSGEPVECVRPGRGSERLA